MSKTHQNVNCQDAPTAKPMACQKFTAEGLNFSPSRTFAFCTFQMKALHWWVRIANFSARQKARQTLAN
jgi:hypothetical protein